MVRLSDFSYKFDHAGVKALASLAQTAGVHDVMWRGEMLCCSVVWCEL